MEGSIPHKGDIWKLVQQLEGCQTFQQVLQKVDLKFNLGYTTGNIQQAPPQIVKWESPVITPKKPTTIQVSTRKFNAEELRYWNSYYQDINDLKRENIYAPKEIYRNRKKLDNKLMTFCYWIEELQKWKLYRPLAKKRTKDTPPELWKWDNNIGRLDWVEGADKMVGPVGICTKSRKDAMVIKKATGLSAVCVLQAEDPSAVSDDILYQIWANIGYKVVCMDNDRKGKETSWWFSERGYHHVNVPDNLLEEGITDMADWAKVYGLDKVTKHMKKKWVI
jgi:hypothetical protein